MADNIDISFVVPACNEERLLPYCLDAIMLEIRHTDCSAEIIVVNNASEDFTPHIAASFNGVRIVYEPVKSLVLARQAGLRVARGNLIANIDADTILPRGWLSRALREFSADCSLVGLSGPFIYYDMSHASSLFVEVFYRLAHCVHFVVQSILRIGAVLQGGNYVARRMALARVNMLESEFSFYGEDSDLGRRLTAIGRVKFTFRLRAFSSARRLNHEGMVRVGVRYAMNFIWATFFGRPFTKSWIDVR